MPVKTTSKAAYYSLREEDKLQPMQRIVLACILRNPGYTRNIVSHETGMKINCVTGRVNALLKDGLVREEGCVKDAISGKSNNCLYVTEAGAYRYEFEKIKKVAA